MGEEQTFGRQEMPCSDGKTNVSKRMLGWHGLCAHSCAGSGGSPADNGRGRSMQEVPHSRSKGNECKVLAGLLTAPSERTALHRSRRQRAPPERQNAIDFIEATASTSTKGNRQNQEGA